MQRSRTLARLLSGELIARLNAIYYLNVGMFAYHAGIVQWVVVGEGVSGSSILSRGCLSWAASAYPVTPFRFQEERGT
jgi:hypothetical protein